MTYAIYGAGGFGREVAPLAQDLVDSLDDISSQDFGDPVVLVSDNPAEVGKTVDGFSIISFEELAERHSYRRVILAVSDANVRRMLSKKVSDAGLSFGTVEAQTYRSLRNVEIGQGAVLCEYTMTGPNVRIGEHFQAGAYSYVHHDCVVGNFVTLAPRVSINGNTSIEDDVYIGTGAVLRQGEPGRPLRIGKGAVIGMGAVVTKDVPAGVTVYGNPARQKT